MLTRSVGALVTSLIALPLIVFGWYGYSLVGITEESTGYRYFYSLRILYSDERPWLPQGQLLGLLHMALHVALTAAGHPPSELFPRIDIWVYLAAAIPIPITIAAFWWATRPIKSMIGQILAAVGFLYVVFEPVSFAGQSIFTPDYLAWAYPAALVLVGWLLRLHREHGVMSLWETAALAVFTGLCVSMKPTYLVFVVPIFLYVLLQGYRAPRTWRDLVLAGVGGLAVGLLIVAAYYRFNLQATRAHLETTLEFSTGGSISPSVITWVMTTVWWPIPAILVALASPVVLVLGLVLLPHKRLTITLLGGVMLALASASQRWYSVTFVETTSFVYAAMVVWVAGVLMPVVVSHRGRLMFAQLVGVLMIAALSAGAWDNAKVTLRQGLWSAEKLNATQSEVQTFLDAHPGQTVVLIPDNNHRPLTVDSSISKGGTDIHNRAWGASPYLAGLYANRQYVIAEAGQYERPVRLDEAETLVFVVGPAGPERTIKPYSGPTVVRDREWAITERWLLDLFDVRLGAWECPVEAFATNNSLVVACARRQEPLVGDAEATPIASPIDLHDISPVGTLLYVESTSELYRADDGGRFTRMTGTAGQQLRLRNYEDDVSAVSDGRVRWNVNQSSNAAVSPPLSAETLTHEWRLTADDQVSVEWLSDAEGAFLRLRPLKPDASILIQFPAPETMAGSPVRLRAVARASRPGITFWMTVFDAQTGVPDRATTRPDALTTDWRLLTLRAPALGASAAIDKIGAGPSGLQPGEYVDVRILEVVPGRRNDR